MRDEAISDDAERATLVLGLGCERDAPAAEVVDLAVSALARIGARARDVAFVATLDLRAGEPAIAAAARHFSAPVVTFPAARLEAETPRLANPSALVFAHTGCHGVAEAAALAKAGEGGRLLVGKTKSAHATAAIAESFPALAAASSGGGFVRSHSDSSRDHA